MKQDKSIHPELFYNKKQGSHLWKFLLLPLFCSDLGLAIGKWVIALHNTLQMMKGDKNLITPRFSTWIAITAISSLLQGCASPTIWGYGPDGQSREDFEHRVEDAFRLQNRMTSVVMVLQSDGSDARYHLPIIQAEQDMEQKCSYLNEYAVRDMDGLSKSLLLQRRVEKSVVGCEVAAHKVEAMLKKYQR
jgi:hypothetical protein